MGAEKLAVVKVIAHRVSWSMGLINRAAVDADSAVQRQIGCGEVGMQCL